MIIQENISLKPHNTFHVDVKADFFAEVNTIEEIQELFDTEKFKTLPKLIIGNGANILFTQDFHGLVIKINLLGISEIDSDDENCILKIAAGEDWEKFVEYSVNRGLGGVENMAMIPGRIGAAPIQNIAAYGQNFSDAFIELEALNIEKMQIERFDREACKFAYRDSIFKHELKGKYVVLSVTMKLQKQPNLQTEYYSRRESVLGELKQFAKEPYTVKDIYDAVVRIRTRKLPDPKIVGTAGSFFKNPTITIVKLHELQKIVPEVQFYPEENLNYSKEKAVESVTKADKVKIAAGWLLDAAGWRGKRVGKCKTADNQALVVINESDATGKEIQEFTQMIQADFYEKYNINLETEVNVI